MTELKTLKDYFIPVSIEALRNELININCGQEGVYTDRTDLINAELQEAKIKERLRQEAIKWVRAMYEQGNYFSPKLFIDFFNLTEEDLK